MYFPIRHFHGLVEFRQQRHRKGKVDDGGVNYALQLRGQVPAETIPAPVDTFRISTPEGNGNSTELVLEWENTRVRIPIQRTS